MTPDAITQLDRYDSVRRSAAIDEAVRRYMESSVGGLNRAGRQTWLRLVKSGIKRGIWGYHRHVDAIRAEFDRILFEQSTPKYEDMR